MDPVTKSKHPIPPGISDYINQNFSEDFLTDITFVKNIHGVGSYYVDITHNSNVYHFKFNENGALLSKEIEQVAYPDDEPEIGNVD